jgi:hypothetical protein
MPLLLTLLTAAPALAVVPEYKPEASLAFFGAFLANRPYLEYGAKTSPLFARKFSLCFVPSLSWQIIVFHL